MTAQRCLSWLRPALPGAEEGIRLICFPPAGGGAASFFGWGQGLPSGCEVVGVDLPREAVATARSPRRRILDVAARLADEMTARCSDRPFAFYGHSAGAIISFELARELRRRGRTLPREMFVSGRRAPQLPLLRHRTLYDLFEPDLVAALADMGEGGGKMSGHPKWRERLLPVIRAHLEISDCYEYYDEAPLSCPILAFCGAQDALVAEAEWRAWCRQTSTRFAGATLSGRHFFDREGQAALLASIGAELAPLSSATQSNLAPTPLAATP